MRNQSEILKLPILSIQDGASIGSVGHIVVNPVSRKADYLVLCGAPWYETPALLPYGKVKSVGRDLITVRSGRDLVAVSDELKKSLAALVDIVGVSVIDSSGEVVSKVADFALDTADGSLQTLFLADGSAVEAAKIVTISACAIITGEGAEEAAEEDSEVQFFLGKTLSDDILDDQGNVLLAAGVVVTHNEIEIARSHNALYELITAVK